MRIILFGSTGTIGRAVGAALTAANHEVIGVSRKAGPHRVDMEDRVSLEAFFARVGAFDAVACSAGDVDAAPLDQITAGQWTHSFAAKVMGQINLVHAALPHIADRGSFTLISGVLTDERIHAGVIGTTVNHAIEGFVKSAAAELSRGIRINCISPTVLVESPAIHPYFPGYQPVPAARVAQAYLRAISNPLNGRVLKLHETDA
ncbi:MAG: short chain dehydrogenase [Kofleriaceae bacterium]